jgi:hypothetical protein
VANEVKPPTETRTDAEVLRQLSRIVKELAEVLSLFENRLEKKSQ